MDPLFAFGRAGAFHRGTYVSLNFFAQRHTDIPPQELTCQIDMSSSACYAGLCRHRSRGLLCSRSYQTKGPQHCQLALVDGNRLVTVWLA